MASYSRREFFCAVSAAAVAVPGIHAMTQATPSPAGARPASARRFRIRTLTAGVTLKGAGDVAALEGALAMLDRVRSAFRNEGYEVQTIRVATQPLAGSPSLAGHKDAIPQLAALDGAAAARGAVLSLGPVLSDDRADNALPSWVADLLAATRATSVTIVVASPRDGKPIACPILR